MSDPRYVYILSDYEESGAQHVVATLDRTRLAAMIGENWPPNNWPIENHQHFIREATASLAEALLKSDEDLAKADGTNLHGGWGGIQLHVVKLAE